MSTKPTKVNPHQNVSPTKSLHVNENTLPSGATFASGGGMPLRLSIAVAMASALIQRDHVIDTVACASKALDFADHLIDRYNKDIEE